MTPDSPVTPVPPQQRMHVNDERLVSLVLDYVRDRLSLAETPLDHPGDKAAIDGLLDGLITPGGTDPAVVMDLYEHHLSQTVLSADTPRFFGFIPAAPTKAACCSTCSCRRVDPGHLLARGGGRRGRGEQVLRWIADAAGLPATAGGASSRGGSAGNLSALVVARETRAAARRARRRAGALPAPAHRGERPGALVDHEHAVAPRHGRVRRPHRRPPAHRRGTARGARCRRRPRDDRGRGRDVGHDQRRHHRRPRRRRARSRASAAGGSTSTARTAAPACSRRACARATTESSTPTRSSSTRTSGCSRRSTAARCSTASRGSPRVHTQDASYLDVIHHDDGSVRVEPDRLRLPPHPPGPRPAAVVLARGLRHRGLHRRRSSRGHPRPADGRARSRRPPQLELIREPDLSRRAVPPYRLDGRDDYDAWAQRLHADEVAFIPHHMGGRDRRPVRLPAPGHHHGPGARDAGDDRVTRAPAARGRMGR